MVKTFYSPHLPYIYGYIARYTFTDLSDTSKNMCYMLGLYVNSAQHVSISKCELCMIKTPLH